MNMGRDDGPDEVFGAALPVRSNGSPIADPEKRFMLAICARLPRSVTPNHMTALGLFGGILCGLGYVLSARDYRWLYLCIFGFIVHWFGDGLDGNLARLRRIERPVFGAYLDQTVDVLAISVTILGAGLSPYVRFDVTLFAMIPYLLLVILRQMRASAIGVDEIAHGGIGGTEGRIVMVLMTIGMINVGPVSYEFAFGRFSSFDLIFLVIGVWGVVSFTADSIKVLRILALREPAAAVSMAEKPRRQQPMENPEFPAAAAVFRNKSLR